MVLKLIQIIQRQVSIGSKSYFYLKMDAKSPVYLLKSVEIMLVWRAMGEPPPFLLI